MKVNKNISLDYEIHQKLDKIDNASQLIEKLLRDYFIDDNIDKDQRNKELREEAIKKADRILNLSNSLRNEFMAVLGREYTIEEWAEFHKRWEENEVGFGVLKFILEIKDKEAEKVLNLK